MVVEVLTNGEEILEYRIFSRDGSNSASLTLSSCIYLVQVDMLDMTSQRKSLLTWKVILMK